MSRSLFRIACLALALATVDCDPKEASFFLPGATSPQTGNLTGLVSSSTSPISAATVALSGTPSRSTTTNAAGIYDFTDLTIGSYTITTTASGYTCISPVVTIQLNQTTTSNIACTLLPGSITGTVRVNGEGQAGIAVTLAQGANTIGTATTGTGGTYAISNVPPGSYSASITPPANTGCTPNPQNVTVQSNQAATANFDCTPLPGSVDGVVRVSGTGQSGVGVALTQGTNTIRTVTTGSFGIYTISNVPPGTYAVAITSPSGTVCSPNPQNVNVQSSQVATANFDCVIDFVVTATTSYRQISVGVSETCVEIVTNPPRPGGTWSTSWSGAGTSGTTQRTGTLDANGRATDRQPINQVGTYNLAVTVTAGGTTRSASGSVAVTAAQGNCLP